MRGEFEKKGVNQLFNHKWFWVDALEVGLKKEPIFQAPVIEQGRYRAASPKASFQLVYLV